MLSLFLISPVARLFAFVAFVYSRFIKFVGSSLPNSYKVGSVFAALLLAFVAIAPAFAQGLPPGGPPGLPNLNNVITSVTPNTGPTTGGTAVTINGTFNLVTSVTFGGVPAASFQVLSQTQVRAVTPPFATPGSVVVGVLTSNFPTPESGFLVNGFTYEPSGVPPPVATISVSPASVTEDGPTNLVFTVSLSRTVPIATLVSVSNSGTANASDYNGSGIPSVFIPANTLSATIVADPTPDAVGEADETVTYTINPSGGATPAYTVGAPSSATGTILNDDGPIIPVVLPVATVSVSPASVTEDGTANLIYTFSLSRTVPTATNLSISRNGTADFADASNVNVPSITIPANTLTATIIVDPTSDPVLEPDETVIYTINPQLGGLDPTYAVGAQSSATGTILNDDAPFPLPPTGGNAIFSVSPNTGPTSGVTPVTLSGNFAAVTGVSFGGSPALSFQVISATQINAVAPPRATVGPVSVSVTASDGTVASATNAYSYIGSVPFPPPIIMPVMASIAVAPASVVEDGATNLTYTVSLSDTRTTATTISYSVSGTANTSDFAPLSGQVIIPANARTATIVVDPIADSSFELDETVILTLSGGSADYIVSFPNSATGTITNDDVAVATVATLTLLNAPATVPELLGILRYRIDFSSAAPVPTTVNLAYSGTAAPGVDYRAPPAGVVVPSGALSFEFTLDTFDNRRIEVDKTVQVSLIAGPGYSLGSSVTTLATILNDDVPFVGISVSPPSAKEDSGQEFVFTVTLSEPSPLGPTRVRLAAFTGGPFYGTPGVDYSGLVPEVVFPVNTTVQTFIVRPIRDTVKEPQEAAGIYVEREPPGVRLTYQPITSTPAVAFILNDDYDAPTITSIDPLEGSAGINSPMPIITLRGTDFDAPNPSVKFGDVPAERFVVSGNGTIQAFPRPLTLADLNRDGVAIRKVTVQTAAGQVVSTQNVVFDGAGPIAAVFPLNITVPTDAGKSTAVVTYIDPLWIDYSDYEDLPTVGLPSGSAFPIGVSTVTFGSADIYNNASTYVLTITVADKEAPALAGVPANIAVNTDPDLPTAVVTWVLPTAKDNVSVTSLTQTAGPAPGTAFPLGVTTVTYRAVDAAGNVSEASFTVTVSDNQAPKLVNLPVNMVIPTQAGRPTAIATWVPPTATDNVAVTRLTQTAGPALGSALPLGQTLITYTAEDAAGNKTSGSFTIIVADTEKPVLVGVPANIVRDTDPQKPTAVVTWVAPTATDNSGTATVSRVEGPAPGSGFPIGVTTVTYQASDAAGNQVRASFTVTIRDAEPPVILGVPANILADTDAGKATATVRWVAPTATDNSGTVTLAQTQGPASGSAFPIGVTTITYVATDPAGNQTTRSFTVTVGDKELPVLVGMPANISVNTDAGLSTAAVTWTVPTATDNVPGVTLRQSEGPARGSAFPLGVTRVTYVAADVAGNTATASFTVTVTDREPPTIVGLSANLSFDIDYPTTTRIVTWAEPTARDNVPGATITQTAGPKSGSAFPIGVTTVTYDAKDVAGNVTKASFTVTVKAIPPGSITFILESQDGGAFAVSGAESALNAAMTASPGRSSMNPILIRPGSYPISFSVPEGAGITEASCSAVGSALNIASKTGTIVLVSGQAVTCTIKTLASQRVATETVATLFEARQALILANQPSTDRRINRLIGRGAAGGGSINLGGFQFANKSPFNVSIGRDGRASFNYSSLQARQLNELASSADPTGGDVDVTRLPGSKRTGVDFWAEGTLAKFEIGKGDGNFAILHLGADYLATKNLLIGATAQLDWIDFDATGDATTKGKGFMVGPYVTARLSESLFFDARVTAGTASNDISPYGTYVDSVESNRTLTSAALIGSFQSGKMTIRPEARLNWFVEESDAYKDSLGVMVPSVRSATGTLDIGPEFRWSMGAKELGDVEFSVGLAGIWAFDQTLKSDANIALERLVLPDFRGRLKSGTLLTLENGVVFNADLFVDGIGGGDYRSWGGSLGVRLGF